MLRIKIPIQVRGGKNCIIIRRDGRRFAPTHFIKWRNMAIFHIKNTVPHNFTAISKPCKVVIHYTAGDRIHRDVPAIVDSLWHCLEKSGVVSDDRFLSDVKLVQFYEKSKPFVDIRIFGYD